MVSPQQAHADDGGPVIAVVDGAVVFLEMMHEFLTDRDYRTILWTTGKDAFEMIVREQPDLVILDVWLEHPCAGEMVLSLMQIDPTTRNIPVIVCTTDACFPKKAAFLNKRCDILVKPFDLDDLLAKIEAMIHRPKHTAPGEDALVS